MVRFETSRFGILEIDEDKIINFPDGIPGFPEIKRYILMDYKDTPLKWLQAVDNPDVAFIVAEPSIFLPDYSIKLDVAIREYLQLKKEEDLAALVIIRVEDGKVIANFQGPLLLNASLMRGVQVVIDRV
ncbi:MAG: flagellar assembly protein FliW [Nitrospirota bacterium]